MRRPVWPAFLVAAAAGTAVGWYWARNNDALQRARLFAPERWRRFAALGWLAAEDDPQRVGLVRDYLAWETVPMLQQRGRRVLAALERSA